VFFPPNNYYYAILDTTYGFFFLLTGQAHSHPLHANAYSSSSLDTVSILYVAIILKCIVHTCTSTNTRCQGSLAMQYLIY
jgi:hypothetical protein